MPQRRLIPRTTVNRATWALLASTALALTLIACGPGSPNGPTPTGDVDITVTVVGDGRATFDAADFTCSDTCTLVVDEGDEVALAAAPNAGRVLVAWEGPCSPFADTCAWRADEDVAVTVTFAPHALRFDLQGDGEGSFTINAAGDETVCREACGVALAQVLDVGVTIQYDSEGSTRTNLDPWIGCDVVNEASTYCLVRVEGVTTVGKTWRLWPLLTVEKDGVGLISSRPPGIDCGDACTSDSEYFDFDTAVTLTAVAVSGTSFTGWTGDQCDGDTTTTCTFTITENTDITAQFAPIPAITYTLTIETIGDGNVTSEPAGINTTTGNNEFDFDLEEDITLTAVADDGFTFTSWTGDQCDGDTTTTCTFTITENTDITAQFAPIPPGPSSPPISPTTFTLTVDTIGDGDGIVISEPEGIDTSAGINEFDFDQDEEVTLTAHPDSNSDFEEWEGVTCTEGDNDEDTCTFILIQDTTVDAEFDD